MVVFDQKNHTYFNPSTKRYYISVSKLLSLYKEPFDRDYFAAKKAKQLGKTQDEVVKMWEQNNKTACDKGQNIHSIVEAYIKDGEVLDDKLIYDFEQQFDKTDFKRILSEEMVYDDDSELAGTSDLICDVDSDYFDVYDIKTNKRFDFYNKYNKHLKVPLNNLQQCHYNDYSLQLSLYAYMYGKLTNKKPRKICIFYHDGTKFNSYPAPYLFWEVSALLKHYKANHGQNPSH
jgi:hypothetical protein